MYPRMFSLLARNPMKVFSWQKQTCGSLNGSFVGSDGMKLTWQVYCVVLPSFSNFGTAHSTAVAAWIQLC